MSKIIIKMTQLPRVDGDSESATFKVALFAFIHI